MQTEQGCINSESEKCKWVSERLSVELKKCFVYTNSSCIILIKICPRVSASDFSPGNPYLNGVCRSWHDIRFIKWDHYILLIWNIPHLDISLTAICHVSYMCCCSVSPSHLSFFVSLSCSGRLLQRSENKCPETTALLSCPRNEAAHTTLWVTLCLTGLSFSQASRFKAPISEDRSGWVVPPVG